MLNSIEEAIDALHSYFGDEDDFQEFLANDEPHDVIFELADSYVDIYTKDLLDWLPDNYTLVEDAIEELGFPERDGKPDMIRAIMQGQYYANEQLLWTVFEKLKNESEI